MSEEVFPALDEVCAPIARAVEELAVTDEEFERFVEEVRDEIWRDNQNRAS